MKIPHIISSPLYVAIPRKRGPYKKYPLNLNHYRNAHYRTSNEAKKIYKTLVANQVKKLPEFSTLSYSATVFARDNRLFDVPNIVSIHEKFLMDAIVEFGKLPDDNYKHIPVSPGWCFGGVEKTRPRVDFFVYGEF